MGKHIIIILDDVGMSGVASFASLIGQDDPPLTPVMDSLAAAGISYTQFRTEPSCSPTRVALHTGQHPHRTGMWQNASTTHTLPDGSEAWAPLDFRTAGTHTTGLFGKMHMGSSANGQALAALHPDDTPAGTIGYDEFIGPFANLSTQTIAGDQMSYYNWTKLAPKTIASPYGVDVGTPGEALGEETAANYATTVTVDDAVTWMEAQVGDFVCVVSFNAPHTPLHVAPASLVSTASKVRRTAAIEAFNLASGGLVSTSVAFSQLMTAQGVPTSINTEAQYNWELIKLAVEAIDTEVTRLLAASTVNLATDTTVWICGDNGSNSNSTIEPEEPEHAKRTIYEGGIRCPLIVRGAAVSDPGETCTGVVSCTDIFETICDVESVSRTGTLDGVSFAATLADASASTGRTYSISEAFDRQGVVDFGLGENDVYSDIDGDKTVMVRALTDGTHKLIRFYDMRDISVHRSELYNISEDPLEERNLLRDPQDESFYSCVRGCTDWAALRRLQREFVILSPGLS